MQQHQDIGDLWTQHKRRTEHTWNCTFCPDKRTFSSEQTLWAHAQVDHRNRLVFAENGKGLDDFKRTYMEECGHKG